MRDARCGRCPRTPLGEVLPRGHDFPALRYRNRVPVSLGAGVSQSWMAWVRTDPHVLSDSPRWVRLRLAEGRARLGPGGPQAARPDQEGRLNSWPPSNNTITAWSIPSCRF